LPLVNDLHHPIIIGLEPNCSIRFAVDFHDQV